jgi:hypothetical protein
MHLWTTIERPDECGDPVEHDVKVEFTAHQTVAASRACWDDPGYPAEYDITFEGAAFDRANIPGGPLTEAELVTVKTWFQANDDKVWQAANDNHQDGPDPDAARDRANDNAWFGVGA